VEQEPENGQYFLDQPILLKNIWRIFEAVDKMSSKNQRPNVETTKKPKSLYDKIRTSDFSSVGLIV
jgi:hypothetical protein